MIIASFNVNSIRARMPVLKRWLASAMPDVVCVQETKAVNEDFPIDDIRGSGYDAVFMGEKSYNGVAILSRLEIESASYGFDGSGLNEGTRLITAKIAGINIINSYIPQGTSPDSDRFIYKLDFFKHLHSYFSKSFNKKDLLIWTGDFNVAPEPIDVHSPEKLLGQVGYHPDEHKALQGVKEWGFVDIFRKHKSGPGFYTFWDYRVRSAVSKGVGWRVDHIWASESAANLSIDSWIDTEPRLWEKPSDHTPILASFKI